MSFGQAIQTVFQKYAEFTGRARRPEFWWWVLFVVLVNLVLNALWVPVGRGTTIGSWLSWLWSLAILLPSLAVLVRRLRDAGYAWGHVFWLLFPFVGTIILIVFAAQPSRDAGAAPRERAAHHRGPTRLAAFDAGQPARRRGHSRRAGAIRRRLDPRGAGDPDCPGAPEPPPGAPSAPEAPPAPDPRSRRRPGRRAECALEVAATAERNGPPSEDDGPSEEVRVSRLAAQPQSLDQRAVTLDVDVLQVAQQATTLSDEQQQTTT